MPYDEAVIYCRISKDRGGAGIKVADQETSCRKLGAELGKHIRAVYTDNDISAAQLKKPRKDYLRMLEDLEADPADIIAMHADRLHRRPAELERYMDITGPARMITYTVMASLLDLATPSGRLVARILGDVASHEVEHMGDRQKRAKQNAAARGIPLGGRRPFGYCAGGMSLCHGEVIMLPAEAQRRGLEPVREVVTRAGTRVAVILPYDEAAELQSACGRLLGGASLHSVARDWNTRGVLTASGYRWSGTEVRRVVLRARNCGDLEHNARQPGESVITTVTPAAWPAVISRADRALLRGLLEDPSRQAPGAERRHLGSGIYRCGTCGATMSITTTSHPAGRLVYRCSAARRPGGPGSGTGHAARDAVSLDAFVLGAVQDWLEEEGNLALLGRPDPPAAGSEDDPAGIDAELEELAAEKAAGRLTVRQLVIASAPLQARRRVLEARQEQARPDVVRGRDIDQLLAAMEADLDLRRSVVGMIFAVRVLAAPNGRPPGWRGGRRYFNPEFVEIERKL